MNFDRKPQKFISAGMALTPPDLVPAGKYPLLKNMRSYLPGSLQTRFGQASVNSSALDQTFVHTLKRFKDDTQGISYRIVGAGTKLYMASLGNLSSAFVIDTGYSGTPLSIVGFQPIQSVQPWHYISGKMRKVKPSGSTGVAYQIGVDPPTWAPAAAFASPIFVDEEDFDAIGPWTNGGTAGAINVVSRVNTTVGTILYDTGTTGWASINPASFDQIQTGAIFNIGSGGGLEKCLVISTSKALPATTIQSISYDSGSTGLCTIQPVAVTSPDGMVDSSSSPFSESDPSGQDTTGVLFPNYQPNTRSSTPVGLTQDAMVVLNGTETVRVLSVNYGPTGISSFRCSTTATHVAAETCVGLSSFRCFLNNNHIAGETLAGSAFQIPVAPGIGFVQNSTPYSFGVIGNRPIQPTDEINISLRIDNLQNFVEARVILDLDPAHSYANNFYQIAIRQNDILAGIKNQTTMASVNQRAVQRRFIDQAKMNYSRQSPILKGKNNAYVEEVEIPDFTLDTDVSVSPTVQTPTGDNQWFDFRFKVSDLDRVGADYSKGLGDVQGIRVQFNASTALNASVDSLWIGGTYGPDIGDLGSPYVYRARYRSTLSGAKSNPGPPMRMGMAAHRQRIQLTGTPSTDPQVDKIDYFRWGGVLTSWIYVVSGDNSSNPVFDDFHDQDIASNPTLDFDNFVPFPVKDIPRSGTCNVVGTSVTQVSGDIFSTQWAPGTVINIDGFPYTLYNQPASSSFLEIVESAGTKTGVKWFISEPLLLKNSFPIIFGPTEGTNFMFGLGNTLMGGTIFWTKNNDPDSSAETNTYDVCAPSEPLMNGGIYDGRVIVGSIKRFWQMIPSLDQPNQYTAVDLPVGKGIFARWAFCIGPKVWFLSTDGIEETDTGPAENISGDLYPLFPHDGNPGVAVNGIQPPDLTQENFLRLSYVHGLLYFDFKDVLGNIASLVYDTMQKAWVSYDVYASPAVIHYGEEEHGINSTMTGGNDGIISQMGALMDNGVAISFAVTPPYFDGGDSRARKLFGDAILDFNANGDSVTATPSMDNGGSSAGASVVTNSARGQSVIDINSGAGTTNRNLTLLITGSSSHGVQLFEWQPSFIIKPEDTFLRYTDWDDDGYAGAKFVQGCVIEADTVNQPRTIQIHDDSDSTQVTLTVQHNGQQEKAYSFVPFITHNLRLVPTDGNSWRLFKMRWVWEPMPELALNWTTQGTTNDQMGYQHLRDGYIALISTSQVTLTVTIDGTNYTYQIASTAGAYLKQYVQFQPIKGKIITYSLTAGSGFRLFQKDCEIRCKSWQSPSGYVTVNPFGSTHRVKGADI